MQNELDIVRDVSARLDGAGIGYMLKEDLILSKLFWARDSHSELQLRDVKNLVSTGCDRAYIEQWTNALGVANLWQEIAHE